MLRTPTPTDSAEIDSERTLDEGADRRRTERVTIAKRSKSFARETPQNVAPRVFGLKPLSMIAGLLLIVAATAFFLNRETPQTAADASLTHRITRGDMRVSVTEQGTLESSNNTEIRCKVLGWSTVNWVIDSGTEVEVGDQLVRLDASGLEEKVNQKKIDYQNSIAAKITAESNVAVAKKSVTEYIKGTFIEEQGTIRQEIFEAEQAVTQAHLSFRAAERLAAKGLIKALQLRKEKFQVESAEQKLILKQTRLTSLEQFKKEKQIEKLGSDLKAAEARLKAAEAQVDLQKVRLDKEEEQLAACVITAQQSGMVIHPKSEAWRDSPDVEEGANVHTNQVLLIMPDLGKMQVKLGIHESVIDRVKAGLKSEVRLRDATLDGEVSEVAKVSKPSGWWDGNVVKFDTIVQLKGQDDLKPGMSAEVKVILAEYENVLTIPVAAVLQTGDENSCWVKTAEGIKKRVLVLGDSNKQFIIVESGLKEGDEVVLNPLAFVDEAQDEVLKPYKPKPQDVKDEEGDAEAETAEPTETDSSSPPLQSKKPIEKDSDGLDSTSELAL
ncbi:efflux RND transporter periplasmic adaptor subunit [Novipirellula artificiosorum]|uniref:Macrolide transporter subunit MacA n=1 Tax=Novipirellula artificiosorum TaxID=2528016 RepID=A0A5C6DZI9_9BACT|nr:hypothetical protein [Novipirellula artificiosorum]TWU40476.1 macrolide transporter subunit MacA [Novipirellula artificiosorum]